MIPAGAGRPPAARLLLACSRPAAAADSRELAACAAGVGDWDAALAAAADHGLLAELAARLAACGVPLPPDVASRLRRARLAAAARAVVLLRELGRVHGVLAAAGIDSVPWKGPVGAALALGDPALREPEDLDLLLRRRDLPRAVAALRAEGFAPLLPVPPRLESEIVRRQGAITLEHPESRLRIDLASSFWHPAFGHRFAPAELLARAVPLRIDGVTLPALPPEETLLALAVHGCGHGWERTCQAADVAALAARTAGVDWGRAFAEARRLRVLRALRTALALVAKLYGPVLPCPAALEAEADPRAVTLAGKAAARAGLPLSPEAPDAGLVELRFQLFALEGARERGAFLWRSATVPNANEAWLRLPPALLPLHRIARPLRLALRHGPRLLAAPLRRGG